MNRDISQLIAVLAQIQADLVSLRTGLGGLAKDVQALQDEVHAVAPASVATAVRVAAREGAAQEVARAANSAQSAGQSAEAVAAMARIAMRLKRRWKVATFAAVAVLVFSTGFAASGLVGVWAPYGCRAHGGEWLEQPTVTGCVFR